MPDPHPLDHLKNTLVNSPAKRASFLAGTLELLRNHGVNVDDPKVVERLGLNLDLADGQKFVKGTTASTLIITITS